MQLPFSLNKKIIKKVVLVSLSVILFILITLIALFQINKDKIAGSLLLKVNEYQDGELKFDDISFNPFIHFPDVSIVLYEIHYYEEKQSLPQADTIPILSLGKLYIDINLIDLLEGEINVPNIYLESGSLNLLVSKNGSFNLINALKKPKIVKLEPVKQKNKTIVPDSLQQNKSKPKKKVVTKIEPAPQLILDLKNIYLNNIDVTYIDQKEGISSIYQLQSLQASLQYLPDTIICTLDTKVFIVDALVANSFGVDSIHVGLNTQLNFDRNFEYIHIKQTELEIDEASFLAYGTMALKGDGAIDMTIKGNDRDFGILNLVFTNVGIDNIEHGDMFFNAFIKGPLFKGLPNIQGTFGIDNLQVNIPSTAQKVSDLTMRANFNSGELDKLEGASFQISKLSAKLPKGKLQGQMGFNNFLAPQINVDLFLKTELSGFNELIKFGKLEKMAGVIELKTKFKGEFNRENKVWKKDEDYSHVIFKNVSISKTEQKKIDAINGKISLQGDELVVDSVNLTINQTDLFFDGSVTNLKLLISKWASNKEMFNSLGGIYFPLDTLLSSQVNFKMGVNANLDNFKPFLPQQSIDSLSGNLSIESTYEGLLHWDGNIFEELVGESSFKFDNVRFDIPKINTIRLIDGTVLLSNTNLYFNNLSINYGKSDALINGTLSNVLYLFQDIEKSIEGKLYIESRVFDYPDAFSYNHTIASAFPYRIKNIHLEVAPKTTTKDLIKFAQTPRLEFNINLLDAVIEDFLPPITISKGYFLLSDKDGGVNLDFDDFKIKMLDGNLSANVDIQTSRKNSNWLKVDADLDNVNLKNSFTYWVDSIPDYFDGVLDGQTQVNMTFGNSKVKFDEVGVTSSELVYKNKEDTIQLQGLSFSATSVNYTKSPNILETFSFKSEIYMNDFKFRELESDSLRYDVIANNGVFNVIPTDRNFLKDQGVGLYTLNPFASPPEFEIAYKVNHFDIADLLQNFSEDPMISGEMKLDLNLKSSGKSQKDLLRNLDGYLSLYGRDLTLQGIDIDKLIDRFKRSQRFTVADVGAFMVMGPLGILVTKGSDYTSMAVTNRDHISKVPEFSSDYLIESGVVTFQDVALSTKLNRMAAVGHIDINMDSLDITVALLNEDGCSIFSQNISGRIIDPAMGKVNAGKLILAPITNLAKNTVGNDCEVVYDGKVKQPKKKGE